MFPLTGSQKRTLLLLGSMAIAGAGIVYAIGELSDRFTQILNFVMPYIAELPIPEMVWKIFLMIVQCSLVIGFLIVYAMVVVWFERKISAHIQSRMGPMYAGGWHGWAQSIADTIKLFLKEDIIPKAANSWIHRLAPVVVFVPMFVCFAVLPFGEGLIPIDLDIGILYIFAISGLSIIGVFMAGWGSGNKFSLLGGLRSAAQSISYEIPRVLSVVPIIMFVGSLKLTTISQYQVGFWRIGDFPVAPRWFIFYPFIGQVAFAIFLVCSLAETNRTPFDIAEAESELVAGFHTEYSGLKFSFFFLAEYSYIFLASGMATALFFGGGSGPILPSWFWFVIKSFSMVILFIWFRWTFPRLRIDRLMELNWKFLLPWSFINILLTGFILLMNR